MAINKNFVVKNGIQVGDNLIFGDSNTGSVGIGTTLPLSTLDVRGTIKSVSVASTELFVSGISTLGVVSAFTVNAQTGNIVSGVVTTINGTTLTYNTGNLTTGNIVTGIVTTLSGSTVTYTTGNLTTLNAQTGNIVTGVVTSITGTDLNYSGIGTISNLKSTQVSVGNSFVITSIGNSVGIGSTLPTKILDVYGDVNIQGNIINNGVTVNANAASIGLVLALGG
jgi:hypothetical protein